MKSNSSLDGTQEPKWLQPQNGILAFPFFNPATGRWHGWIDGVMTDITEEYQAYSREHFGLLKTSKDTTS